MVNELTEEIKAEIDNMSHVEMARHYRFDEVGSIYFINGPISDYFMEKWNRLGGMNPQISKQIGW